jgi:hypothetical protein
VTIIRAARVIVQSDADGVLAEHSLLLWEAQPPTIEINSTDYARFAHFSQGFKNL